MLTVVQALLLGALLLVAVVTLAPRRAQPLLAALALLAAVPAVTAPVASAQALQLWLETRYDRTGVDRVPSPAGIIVAGGGLATYVVDVMQGLPLDDRGRSGRISGAAELTRRFPAARVVHTGREEIAARDVFIRLGIAPERIVIEDTSTTTYENAVNAARLLSPRPGETWILVTSAVHMPRAMATFRSAGFDVVAYPVDYEADTARALPPRAGQAPARGWSRGQRELLAILAYVATGRIKPWRLAF